MGKWANKGVVKEVSDIAENQSVAFDLDIDSELLEKALHNKDLLREL